MYKEVSYQEEYDGTITFYFEDEPFVNDGQDEVSQYISVEKSEVIDCILENNLVGCEVIDSDDDSILFSRPSIYNDFDGSPLMETPTRQSIDQILQDMPSKVISQLAYQLAKQKEFIFQDPNDKEFHAQEQRSELRWLMGA